MSAETRAVASDEKLNDLRLLVGRRIRELRQERGIGLRTLAAESGVTSGFLSQVESGRVMPSIASLVGVCAVLQVHVGDVFDAEGSKARLVRRPDRIVYSYPETGVRDEVLTADPTYRIEVVHTYFDPKGSTGGQPYSHGSQVEAAIVLKGRLVIRLGAEEFALRAGDALTFPGTLLHDVQNPLDRPAEAIWVYSPATY
jgi:transcriptional regulator with XRE-family HTH domain